VSTNAYLTFSGEHTKCGADQHDCGRSYEIPSTAAPNDMIAPYWTDLDMRSGGSVYTYTIDPTDDSSTAGVGAGGDTAHATSCQHGIPAGAWTGGADSAIGEGNVVHQACCAASCGTCGGADCDKVRKTSSWPRIWSNFSRL